MIILPLGDSNVFTLFVPLYASDWVILLFGLRISNTFFDQLQSTIEPLCDLSFCLFFAIILTITIPFYHIWEIIPLSSLVDIYMLDFIQI